MAELIQIPQVHSAININTFSDFNCYCLGPCPCCIDIKLTAPSYEADGELRAPIDLVAVIDRSGSMSGEKLNLVVKVLHFVALHLKSVDRLAIVTYDDNIEELVSLAYVTQTNHIQFDAKIRKIIAGGSTNLSGGLIKGMNIMNKREMKKADVASVLLFTDGMANSGITNTNDILIAMQNIFAGKKDFTVNTFGFGSDHNANMLKEISRVGNGLYYFIQTTEQIPEIFTNCLGGLLSTVGQNISISIETLNGATIKAIIFKEKTVLSNGNKKGVVGMGDLQSEEERDILVELSLPKADTTTSLYTYANVTLNYFNVIKKDNDQHMKEVVIERLSDIRTRNPSLEVDEQRNRIQTIASLARAAELAEEGKLEEASKVITYQQSHIFNSCSQTSPRVSSLNTDLNIAMENLSSKDIYSSRGKFAITSLTDSHSKQRSTGGCRSSSYATSSRENTQSHYQNAMMFYEDDQPSRQKVVPITISEEQPELPPKLTDPEADPSAYPPPIPKKGSRLSLNLDTRRNPLSDGKPDSEKGPPFINEM